MRIFQLLPLLSAIAVYGCASSAYKSGQRNFDKGVSALERKDYQVAYRFLEEPSAGTEAEVLSLMKQNRQVVEAGRSTFTLAELAESIGRYGREQAFKIEHSRLQRFSVYSEFSAFREAADSIAAVFPQELAAYHERAAELARIAKLPDADQQKHWAEVFKRSVEASTVRGIIASSQLVDLSRPGSTAGTNLGAAIAQAIYIDSASWRNYRATTQIGAGLLGALLGSSVDSAPTIVFQKTYFVRTKSGDLKRIDERSSDPILFPAGACIEYREPFQLEVVNQTLCGQ